MVIDLSDIPNLKNCVYKITSPSGKIYIGSTIKLRRRLNRYRRGNCPKQWKLLNSFNKYDPSNHVFEIIEKDLLLEDLYKREAYWGNFYNVLGDCGLNLQLPKASDIRKTISEESRQRRREAQLGKKHTPEAIEKIRTASTGRKYPNRKPFSEETRKKFSEARKGVKRSPEFCEKMSKMWKGRIVSKETREKISKGLREYYEKKGFISERKRREEANIGKTHREIYKNQIEKASKIVLDTQTGVYYTSSLELANLYKKSKTRVLERLNKKDVRFIYV